MSDLTKYTCYNCKYFAKNNCGNPTRTEPCEGKELPPTEEQCRNFFRDLKGTFDNTTGNYVPTEKIAEKMGIGVNEASDFLWATVKYNDIPLDRNCGLWSW